MPDALAEEAPGDVAPREVRTAADRRVWLLTAGRVSRVALVLGSALDRPPGTCVELAAKALEAAVRGPRLGPRDPDRLALVRLRRADGASCAMIAAELGCNKASVSKLLRRWGADRA